MTITNPVDDEEPQECLRARPVQLIHHDDPVVQIAKGESR